MNAATKTTTGCVTLTSSPTLLTCTTQPATAVHTAYLALAACGSLVATYTDRVFTFSTLYSPQVLAVSPTVCGTFGGYALAVTGLGFGSGSEELSITVGGYACTQSTYVASSTVQCLMPAAHAYAGGYEAAVVVRITDWGVSNSDVKVRLVSFWSDPGTWPNSTLPAAGDNVVVTPMSDIVLDVQTPVLASVLVHGHLESVTGELMTAMGAAQLAALQVYFQGIPSA